MPVGRNFKILKNGTVLAAVRSKTFTWGGESIDLSSDDDGGKRLLDDDVGQEQIDISGDGVMLGVTLRELVLGSGSKMLDDITLEFPILTSSNTTPAELSCNFRITSYEESGSYNGEITFSFSLESSGDWTYTAEAA